MKSAALLLHALVAVVVLTVAEHPARVPDTNNVRRVRSWTNPPGVTPFHKTSVAGNSRPQASQSLGSEALNKTAVIV